MLKINLKTDNEKLYNGALLLSKKLKVDFSEDGFKISAEKGNKLHIECDGKEGKITYITKVSFFRMLSLFIKNYLEKKEFSYSEEIHINTLSAFLDLSRNAVLKVESVKDYIEYLAMMGFDQLELYIEDIYELSGYPYFGYMRGRYTVEELKEIDDYAYGLGIEIIAYIQTLGHMSTYLDWDEAGPVRDTFKCLLAGSEKTYALIDKMFETLSGALRSRNIKVGLDETTGMGSGNYYKKFGHKEPIDLFFEHLNEVSKIAKKYGYTMYMAGDMFFKIIEIGGVTDETLLTERIKKYVPENVKVTYWDYLNDTVEDYDKGIKRYTKYFKDVTYLGAVISWFGFTVDTKMTYTAVNCSMQAVKANGIQTVGAATFGDNGCEANHFLTLCGMQLFAEHKYTNDNVTKRAKENFEFITGAKFDAFMDMSEFHNILDGKKYDKYWHKYYGKRYLYQDVLAGTSDYNLDINPISEHYYKYAKIMDKYIDDTDNRWNEFYIYSKHLFELVALKTEIAENLRKAYFANDKDALKEYADIKFPALKDKLYNLNKEMLKIWYKYNKPTGAEVLDLRLSGLMGRAETASIRINQYLNGEIEKIEELEYERLPFATYNSNFFKYIYTVNLL